MLDALARGVPCAASPHAADGLRDSSTVARASDPSPRALAEAIARLAGAPALRAELAQRGRRYIATQHDDRSYLDALDRALSRASHART
jgi:hypothetical protein